jgi:hypothetical protein
MTGGQAECAILWELAKRAVAQRASRRQREVARWWRAESGWGGLGEGHMRAIVLDCHLPVAGIFFEQIKPTQTHSCAIGTLADRLPKMRSKNRYCNAKNLRHFEGSFIQHKHLGE